MPVMLHALTETADQMSQTEHAHRLIRVGRISAIVTDIDADMADDEKRVIEVALRHNALLNSYSVMCTVLPVRFGTVLPNENSVVTHIADNSDIYRKKIADFCGQHEYMIQLVTGQRPAKAQMLSAVASGQTFLRERLAARHVKETAWLQRRAFAEDLAKRITAEATRYATPSQEKKEHLIDISILASQDQVQRINEIARAQIDQMEALNLILKMRGPFPPYSFISAAEEGPLCDVT